MLPSSDDETNPIDPPVAESAVPNLIGPLVASMVGGAVVSATLAASGFSLGVAALAYPLSGSLILFILVTSKVVARAFARQSIRQRKRALAQG